MILYCFLAVNLASFFTFTADKIKAVHQRWRIKERTLWLFSLLGGATGSFLAMKLVRHKTKHKSFAVGIPLLAFFQLAVVIYLYFYLH